MSEKEALLPTKHISATNAPLKVRKYSEPPEHLRMRRTTRAFAQ